MGRMLPVACMAVGVGVWWSPAVVRAVAGVVAVWWRDRRRERWDRCRDFHAMRAAFPTNAEDRHG
jgi:hypothetical protein